MNMLARVERRLAERRAERRDGRRTTDQRPALSILDACRELGIPPVGGNGTWRPPEE